MWGVGPVNRGRTVRTKGRGVHPKKGGNLCLTVILGALKACEGPGVATGAPRVDCGWLMGWRGQETQRWSDLSMVVARRGKGEPLRAGPALWARGAPGTTTSASGWVSAHPQWISGLARSCRPQLCVQDLRLGWRGQG